MRMRAKRAFIRAQRTRTIRAARPGSFGRKSSGLRMTS